MSYAPFSIEAPISGRTFLALGEAVEAVFNATDWTKFSYEVDEADFVRQHPRLLRSLSFGDTDYGEAVLQTLRYFQDHRPSALHALAARLKVRKWLEANTPDAAAELGLTQAHVLAPVKVLNASEVVERALKDAQHLLHTSGPISCVDRLHTALHGYLRTICDDAGLVNAPDARLPTLFKLLRREHPRFKDLGSQDEAIGRVMNSLASAVDALDLLRNHASVAHPNQTLLGEAEAMLVVNMTHSLFHYLEAKK